MSAAGGVKRAPLPGWLAAQMRMVVKAKEEKPLSPYAAELVLQAHALAQRARKLERLVARMAECQGGNVLCRECIGDAARMVPPRPRRKRKGVA